VKINFVILLIALVILGFTALFENNYLDYSPPIPYSNLRSIDFSDFKGYKLPGQALQGTNEFAFIKTNRVVKFFSGKTLTVTTFFYPSRSYVYNQEIRSEDLLSHELYHMQITEYFSRLFRKEATEYTEDITSSQINFWERKYNRLENEMQMQYDDESDHSYVLSEQIRWEKKIDSCLNSLSKYGDSLIVLKK